MPTDRSAVGDIHNHNDHNDDDNDDQRTDRTSTPPSSTTGAGLVSRVLTEAKHVPWLVTQRTPLARVDIWHGRCDLPALAR